jgi:hypothetical protein
MVRAILEGRKTVTRRVCKPPYGGHPGLRLPGRCPYGARGDRLWVRETFCPVDDREHGGPEWIDYRATPRYSAAHPAGWENDPGDPQALKWKPSIFMPRSACRIVLEIEDVRAERLHEITHDDARAEGIDVGIVAAGDGWPNPTVAFARLWDSINGKRYPWASNPWVWRVQFRRITPA